MWNSQVIIMLLEGIRDTLYMTLASTLFGYIIGLPMGIVLTVTDKDGIRRMRQSTRCWKCFPPCCAVFRLLFC